MQEILKYIEANLPEIIVVWQSLFVALAGLFELLGLSRWSKIFGTFSVFDLGRIVRILKAILAMAEVSKLPKGIGKAGIVVVLLSLNSCSFLRSPTFWDGFEKTCEIALTATPEVKAKSLATGTPVEEIAAIVCAVADVVDPFIRAEMAAKEGRKLTGEPPTQQAVAIARVKGLL